MRGPLAGYTMTSLLDSVTSLSWWIGVVLVGLAINIAAAYLKPRLDGVMGSVSTRWAKANSKRQLERNERLNLLASSEHEQVLSGLEELRLRIRSFGYCFQAIVLAAIAEYALEPDGGSSLVRASYLALMIFSIIVLLIALDDWRLAWRNQRDLSSLRQDRAGSKSDELSEATPANPRLHPDEGH